MASSTRFGRKIPLPSTRQIRHELTLLMQADEQRNAAKARESGASSPTGSPEPPVAGT